MENKLQLLTEREVARLLRLSVQTLRNNRCACRGLVYCKIGGRSVRYRLSDVQAFIDNGRIEPSAE